MYSQYKLNTTDKLERNLLIAVLQEYDFNGFEETSDAVIGYIDASLLSTDEVKSILQKHNLSYISFEYEEIPDKNWNSEWESSFSPVEIGPSSAGIASEGRATLAETRWTRADPDPIPQC